MAGSGSFSFRNWKVYRDTALSVGRVGPWRLLPGIARIEVSLKWKELFGGRIVHHGDSEDTERPLTQRRSDARTQDDTLLSRELEATRKDGQAVHGTRKLWGPETFPEYLALIEPDDRGRVAGGTLRAFLLGESRQWEATFRRGGLVILARAKTVAPGRVVGVDIELGKIREWEPPMNTAGQMSHLTSWNSLP